MSNLIFGDNLVLFVSDNFRKHNEKNMYIKYILNYFLSLLS